LQELSDFELVAIVEPSPSYLRHTMREVRAPVVSSLSELGSIPFQAAVVAVPTRAHAPLVAELIRMRKDLLVEKPLCSSSGEAAELVRLSQRYKTKLAVGYVERFNPVVRKLKEVIDHGYLGTPLHYSFTRVGGYPNEAGQGNNVLLDLAVHDIDVLNLLEGRMAYLSSACHCSVQRKVPDTAEILLRAPGGGASASIHVNWITPTKIRNVRVTGTHGVAMIDYMLQTCLVHGGNLLGDRKAPRLNFHDLVEAYRCGDRVEFQVEKQEPLRNELLHFAKLIRGESSLSCLAKDGLVSLRLAEEVFSHG
jgi:UDP-N-acetylglucosamine 3-dehydrogenase